VIFTVGIIVSFIVYVFVGLILSRKVQNSEEYYVSGRSGSTLMITGTLVASFLSTVSFMGEAGFSYEGYPILLLILVIFNASGYVFGVFLFGRYLRRSQSLTVPEYFGNRFQSNKVRMAAAITTVLGIAAYLVAVTQGAALLLSEISGVSYAAALLIMWIVYSSFTILSGARGVMVNDTIMFFLFSIATYLAFPFIIKAAGGFPDAITKAAHLPARPDLLSWHGITGSGAYMGTPWEALAWAVIMGLVWGAVVAISPWQCSRYLMAKNEHVAIRSGVWATISIITIYLFLHISVSTITTIKADIAPSEKVFVWAAMNIVPTWLGVIIISGIMAAALSSCSSFLQLIGSSITRDIMEQSRNKTYSDKQLLRASRISRICIRRGNRCGTDVPGKNLAASSRSGRSQRNGRYAQVSRVFDDKRHYGYRRYIRILLLACFSYYAVAEKRIYRTFYALSRCKKGSVFPAYLFCENHEKRRRRKEEMRSREEKGLRLFLH
jgi:sodium/pantothenate symporter